MKGWPERETHKRACPRCEVMLEAAAGGRVLWVCGHCAAFLARDTPETAWDLDDTVSQPPWPKP